MFRPLDGELAMSAAAPAELHFGVLVTADGSVRAERLGRLTEIRADSRLYPWTMPSPPATGNWPPRWWPPGASRARVMDLLIAATAHAHSARLYTRNASDLVGIEDLVEIISV